MLINVDIHKIIDSMKMAKIGLFARTIGDIASKNSCYVRIAAMKKIEVK